MIDHHNKPVAIITGSGSGMGAAIARELHARGYKLALMSPSGRSTLLAEQLGAIGLDGSVANADDLQRLVDATMERYGHIDGVVNNTKHPKTGSLPNIDDELWLQEHELIFLSVQRLARLVTPIMKNQGGGAFVNITTLATFEPDANYPISCAYRAAVASYTKMYADLYGADNIRMNALLPGYIDSMAHDGAAAGAIPLRRFGRVDEIAKTAAFLLSDEAGYITGQNIRVDGGLTRHL